MNAPGYRDVKASGIRLRVTDVGSGPVVLFLHSALLSRRTWDRVQELLAPSFRVVALDLPGFGESEKPSAARFAYTIEAFRGVVTDLFAGLQLGRAHVVGHGLGGAIALAIAAQTPELCGKLVLAGAHCYPTTRDLARRMASVPLVGGLLFKQVLGRTAFRAYFRDVLVSNARRIESERPDQFFATLASPEGRNSALATLRATHDARSVVAQLTRIQSPSLVVWGRHDQIYPAALGRRLAREIRGAGFELLDTGHLVHEEAPERFAELVRDFCQERRAR